jgi:two-component system sensor histidine kinase PilS (NtrC family)
VPVGEPVRGGAPGAGEAEEGARRRRRLLRLMGARLALSAFALVVALTLVGVREGGETAERGLYGTMAAAFAATALYAVAFGRVRHWARFGALQVATDVALLTALVHFSGGKDSIFTFLHVPVVVYAAQLFGRPGAYGAAAAASFGYGAVLLGAERGWLSPVSEGPSSPVPWFTLWGLHTVAWLLVALLSSTLSRELHRAGRELDRRRRDLARLRRLHELTVESLTSGLLTTGLAGRITSFNREAARITGLPVGRALGLDVEEVLPGVRALVLEPGGHPARMRARLQFARADGLKLHLGVAASVLRDTEGRPAGHVVIFQDVTEVVRMEAELRRSERLAAVGELAAGMAHEVRNPLAAISGAIQVLRAGLDDPGELASRVRLMDIVVRETDRVDALIGEFLRFARPAPPKLARVQLLPLVEEVRAVLANDLPAEVTLESAVPPGLAAWADPDQLRQVLWNLLLNAVQALPEGGRVRVEAQAVPPPQEHWPEGRRALQGRNPWVEVSVADTGRGIPPEALERIFEPFFTTRPSGSGLGLATVHRIVEGHGGVVRVRSAPGQGTVFRVLLRQEETP